MQIQVLENNGDAPADAEYLACTAGFFKPPSRIVAERIDGIMRVDTILFDHLVTFACDGHRYLHFMDDDSLDATMIRQNLENVVNIRDVSGYLCPPKNFEDFEMYGVDPDDDPFHNGYMYLWYCGRDGGS